MLSAREIYNFDFNSSFIRRVLCSYYRPDRYYRIPFGALRGVDIWYDRSINFHAVLGLWEKANFIALKKVLDKLSRDRQIIHAYDIGANIGLFTLFFSRYSSAMKVVAFEPVHDTLLKLERNIARNKATNVSVVEKAVGDIDGQVTFYLGHHHKSSLEKQWTSDRGTTEVEEIEVCSLKLDSFIIENSKLPPDIIKIDVEGAGGRVLTGAREVLEKHRPVILIESHTAREDDDIIRVLEQYSYKAFRIDDYRWVANPKRNYRDPGGVWGTMLLFPKENSCGYF